MTHDNQSQVKPPGYFILEELDARGWTQTDLSYITEISPQQLNPILKGKGGISADMAVILGDAFDMPPDFFINLETQFQLSKAKQAPPGVKKRALWQSVFPVREMLKRGWIEESDPFLLDVQMLRFFEKSCIEDVPYMGSTDLEVSFAAKKTNQNEIRAEEIAWLYRVRQIAKTIEAPPFSPDMMMDCIEKLKSLLASREDVAYVPSILNSYGIRFIMVETLPKAKFDGVCTWIDDQPVIGITNKYDRLDNFWFVLRHELEHVIQGDGKDKGYATIDYLEGENRNTDEIIEMEERIANAAASEFCLPKDQLQSFIARKSPYFSEKDILGFANRLEIHPAIAVGQLQFALQKWNLFRKYLAVSVAGVRDILISELQKKNINAVDGWGYHSKTQL